MSNRLLMVDVSSNNGHVDVHALHRAGFPAIGVKATEGTSYVNPYYAETVAVAHQLGMAVVHYHFPVATSSGVTDAKHFLATVRPHVKTLDDELVLDMEPIISGTPWSAGEAQRYTDAFLHVVWDECPKVGLLHRRVRRMAYGPPYFLRDCGIRPHHREGLWVASYGGSQPVFIPPGWRTWRCWQFTDRATVDGVQGGVDESHIRPSVLRRIRAYPTLRQGDNGPAVRLLQHLINERVEGKALTVTGHFDVATKIRVNDVHHLLGHKRIGVAGPRIWRYLLRLPKGNR